MEDLIFALVIIGILLIIVLYSYLSAHVKKYKEMKSRAEILHKNGEEQKIEIERLLNIIEELKKENENIKECDNVLMSCPK